MRRDVAPLSILLTKTYLIYLEAPFSDNTCNNSQVNTTFWETGMIDRHAKLKGR